MQVFFAPILEVLFWGGGGNDEKNRHSQGSGGGETAKNEVSGDAISGYERLFREQF